MCGVAVIFCASVSALVVVATDAFGSPADAFASGQTDTVGCGTAAQYLAMRHFYYPHSGQLICFLVHIAFVFIAIRLFSLSKEVRTIGVFPCYFVLFCLRS